MYNFIIYNVIKYLNLLLKVNNKTMVKILLVEKGGVLKNTNIREVVESELYKKVNLKSGEDFKSKHTWEIKSKKVYEEKLYVTLYAKSEGRANSENKYDFPPPVDNELYFGTCIVLCKTKSGDYIDLEISLWEKIYEHLFGGFDSLVDTMKEDEEEEDELENVPKKYKTKEGYLKDDFVIEGSDDEMADYEGQEEDDDDEDEEHAEDEEDEEDD